MGTREAYEEKLRSGNLYQDPTIYPGLGSPRCLSLLNPNPEREGWTITPVLHDATAVAGAGIGAILNAVHGLNTASSIAAIFWCQRSIWRSEVLVTTHSNG